MQDGFEIKAAAQGGYYVIAADDPSNRGVFRGILLAGSLTECLSFIEKEFRKREPKASK